MTQPIDLETEVHCAIGHASVCWVELPTSEFDSNEALKVGEDLMTKIRAALEAAKQEGRRQAIEELTDPQVVHLAMLRGTIAKISMLQCAHTHGEQAVTEYRAFSEGRRQGLEEAAKVCETVADGYREKERFKWAEMKTDAETGATDCECAIHALIEKDDQK